MFSHQSISRIINNNRYEECLQLLEQIMPWDDGDDAEAADDPDGYGAHPMPSSGDLQEIRAAILLAATEQQQQEEEEAAVAPSKAKTKATAAAVPAVAPSTRARKKGAAGAGAKGVTQQHTQQQERGAGEAYGDGVDVARSVLGTLAALCCLRAQIYEVWMGWVRLCAYSSMFPLHEPHPDTQIRNNSRRTTARGLWPGASTRCAWTFTAWRRSSSWWSASCSGGSRSLLM